MKVKINMAAVIESTWQVVNGTCRSSDITSALSDGVYELLATAYNRETRTLFEYDRETLEELSNLVATIFLEQDFESKFWDVMAGTGNDICRGCGWWAEDVVYSADDYEDSPISEGCMCSECAENLEEKAQ